MLNMLYNMSYKYIIHNIYIIYNDIDTIIIIIYVQYLLLKQSTCSIAVSHRKHSIDQVSQLLLLLGDRNPYSTL